MAVRLVVADANTMALMGYTAAVSAHPDLALVGKAASAAEAGRLVTALRPDVVVLDVDLPGATGHELGVRLRAERPDLGIVLVGPQDNELLIQALEERFSAYLPRAASIDLLLSAARHAAVVPTSFTAPELAVALARRRAANALLSRREIEVLRHLHNGSTNAKIAGSLRLTESTVRTYLSRVYDKLGVNTRAQALVAADERGLL